MWRIWDMFCSVQVEPDIHKFVFNCCRMEVMFLQSLRMAKSSSVGEGWVKMRAVVPLSPLHCTLNCKMKRQNKTKKKKNFQTLVVLIDKTPLWCSFSQMTTVTPLWWRSAVTSSASAAPAFTSFCWNFRAVPKQLQNIAWLWPFFKQLTWSNSLLHLWISVWSWEKGLITLSVDSPDYSC